MKQPLEALPDSTTAIGVNNWFQAAVVDEPPIDTVAARIDLPAPDRITEGAKDRIEVGISGIETASLVSSHLDV